MSQRIVPAADLHPAQLIGKILIELGQVGTDGIPLIQRLVQIVDDIDSALDGGFKQRPIFLTQRQLRLGQPLHQLVVQQEKQLSLGHGIDALFLILLEASHFHFMWHSLSIAAHHL